MTQLDDFLKQFLQRPLEDVVKRKKEYWQVSENLKPIIQDTPRLRIQGTYLGRDGGRYFRPSLALLDVIGPRTTNHVIVDDKGSWFFLCGRDVFEKHVIEDSSTEHVFLVKTENQEVLGYGMWNNAQQDMVKNILDKGDYLRREAT